MDNEFENSVKKIVWALRRIVSLIYLDSRKMIKRFGITGPQSLVMKPLFHATESYSSASLSRILNMTPANMTGIIDRLEEKELVKRTRTKEDRRKTLIVLTEKGKELSERLSDPIEEKLMNGLKDLQPTEIFGIYSALNHIIDLIGVQYVTDASVDQDQFSMTGNLTSQQ